MYGNIISENENNIKSEKILFAVYGTADKTDFSDFSHFGIQTTKYAFGEAIRKELFFTRFVDFLETHHISLENLRDFDFSDFFAHSS